jgi:glycosyltransferase involved in cell wall biosynthesis
MKARGHEMQMISLTRGAFHPEYSKVMELIPLRGKLGYTRTILPIRKAVKKFDPDIVHGHYLSGGGFYSATCGAKHVLTSAWGSDIYIEPRYFLKRQYIKFALRHSEIVIGDSDHILEEVRKLAPNARTEKILFGIDTELFKPNPVKHDKFRFLSIRATSKNYNPLIVVKAFEEANLDAELWMQSPSAESFEIYDYVKSKPDLDKRIKWLDKRPYDKMPEIYNQVDVGISIPSTDSSSTAMMECLSCGVPTIISDIPQNKEWFTKEGGTILTDVDAHDLSVKMMLMMLLNRKGLEEVGADARMQVIEKGSFETEMLKAERIYQEVLDGKA